MAKFITRTIVSTEITVAELKIGSTEMLPLEKLVVEGKLTEEKAIKIVNKEYKGRQVVIIGLEVKEDKYRVSTEDFMHIAELVVDGEEDSDMEVQSDTDALIEKHTPAV